MWTIILCRRALSWKTITCFFIRNSKFELLMFLRGFGLREYFLTIKEPFNSSAYKSVSYKTSYIENTYVGKMSTSKIKMSWSWSVCEFTTWWYIFFYKKRAILSSASAFLLAISWSFFFCFLIIWTIIRL